MLLRFFPVPKFLSMHAAGLAISDTDIRLVDFADEHGHTVLKTHHTEPVAEGAIVGGVVKNIQPLIATLKEVHARSQARFVNVSLPEEKAFLFRATIEASEKEEVIRTAVEFQIKEQVPLASNEVVFDYMTLGKPKNNKLGVMVSVMSRTVINSYLSALRAAGFSPVSLAIESQAIANAVVPDTDEGTYIIVNIEEKQTGLSIVHSGIVQFTSTLSVPRDQIKKEINNPSPDTGSVLQKEIEKLQIYWNTHREERYDNASPVQKVLLCGDCGRDNCFSNFFGASLSVPVEVANVWVNAFSFDDYVPDIFYNESLQYAEAVGLALPNIERY